MNISDHIRNTSAFRPSRRVAAFGAATVVVALLIQALPASIAERLNAEDGPFEVGSAVLLGVALLVGLAGPPQAAHNAAPGRRGRARGAALP